MKLFDKIAIDPKQLQCATELEKKVFVYAWDKTKSFGLHFRSCDVVYGPIGEPSAAMFELLDDLASRKLTGDLARVLVINFAEKHGSLIQLICNKHLQIGISAATVNKYIPKLIPIFQVQLAKEEVIQKVKFPCYGQLKYDGVRIIVMKTLDEQILFYTRNGLQIHLPMLAQLFEEIPTGLIFDTEVTIKEGKMVDRTKVSGMINSARQKGKIQETLLCFNVFDMMTIEEFQKQQCLLPYSKRLEHLAYTYEYLLPDTVKEAMKLAETRVLKSVSEASEWLSNAWSNGDEGLILKPLDHLYTFKRSKDWIKFKATKSADLKCIKVEEGDNKYTGMIGALVCEGIIEHVRVKVRIGSGLTDNDRGMKPSYYIGKTIEIKYNSIVSNKNGTTSLQAPRFVMVRYDK